MLEEMEIDGSFDLPEQLLLLHKWNYDYVGCEYAAALNQVYRINELGLNEMFL